MTKDSKERELTVLQVSTAPGDIHSCLR